MCNVRLLKEYIFRLIAMICLLLILTFLALIFISLFKKAVPNIYITELQISYIDKELKPEAILDKNLAQLNLLEYKDKLFSRSMIYEIANAGDNKVWIPLRLDIEKSAFKENWNKLIEDGKIRTVFNKRFFKDGDSAYPEIAGIGASLKGLLLLVAIASSISIPLAIFSGIFFEIFAKRSFIVKTLEFLIFNLASIPSIIFGILGFVIFSYFDIPRSSPLMGGLTLAFMMVPIINIVTQESIRRTPKIVLEAALSLGIPKIHILWDYILPASLFDILKGILLAISRIIGETAPLIIVGMVGFMPDFPKSFTSPSSTLATIIYLWSEAPDSAFVSKTASATISLLFIVIVINLLSELINKKSFE